MNVNKKKKKFPTLLTGLLAFAMTSSYFQISNSMGHHENLVEAATTSGQIRTFSNTSTGRLGADVDNSTGTLGGNIMMKDGLYYWTVPETGKYTIEAWGAQGGSQPEFAYGGRGAQMKGDFNLQEGQTVVILVGQQGTNASSDMDAGGGGGTFVVKGSTPTNASPLMIAGGGAGDSADSKGGDGTITQASSGVFYPNNNIGYGAMDGTGGGGGGLESTGITRNNGVGGAGFRQGGAGGDATYDGGFGGGAGGSDENGAGGGGYTGGNGYDGPSGGGGSFNIGLNQSNTNAVKVGQGQVVITFQTKSTDLNSPTSLVYNQSKTFNNTSVGNTGSNTNNSSGTLSGTVSMSDGMYLWSVPDTGLYHIEAKGAKGADSNNGTVFGGKGAKIIGDFYFEKGEQLKLLIGQEGVYDATTNCSAGGGGTFVASSLNTPYIVAGGGGGTNSSAGISANGGGGQIIAGNGLGGNGSASGGGFTGNGNADSWVTPGASAFVNGGKGGGKGAYNNYGGFGGGANTHGNCGTTYVGGGGYTGGSSGLASTNGGTSYNMGLNQENTAAFNNGQGQVVITYVEPTVTQSPSNGTKFQASYVDVSWSINKGANTTISHYDIQAGTTPGGTNILALTNKGTATTQRFAVPAGTAGNTTIYWRVRAIQSDGSMGRWKESTVIYSNNVPTITATTNVPANLDVSLEKRQHAFSITSLKDTDDFNYVTLFADVLDQNGTVVAGSKKQIVLEPSLVNSPSLLSGTATEKEGSLQGPVNYTTPFGLKLVLQPDFTTGKYDVTLTKTDGTTNVVKSNQKLITGKTMQVSSATTPEHYTLRLYPEDRQNTNALSSAPLAGINDVASVSIPFTTDTHNYLPRLTKMKQDVGKRVFSDAEGFNRISVTGHVDDMSPNDKVSVYYEVQPKATNYSIQLANSDGKVVPRYGVVTKTYDPKVDNDFSFTYQISPDLESGNYALLVYGYDSQEGIGDYFEIPFKLDRGAPTIDFTNEYLTASGTTITMSSAERQIMGEDSKVKLAFTANNYATFEYAGYLIRGGTVKDLRIRGAFTNAVKATFIGVNLGQDPITLLDGTTTDFQNGDIVVFKFKATSATGIVTKKDVRILIGEDENNFNPINDANLPVIP